MNAEKRVEELEAKCKALVEDNAQREKALREQVCRAAPCALSELHSHLQIDNLNEQGRDLRQQFDQQRQLVTSISALRLMRRFLSCRSRVSTCNAR